MSELTVVASYGRSAGSSRVRAYDWVDFLGLQATEMSYLNTSNLSPKTVVRRLPQVLSAERRLRGSSARSKRVLLSRRATPFSRGRVERRLLRQAEWGVYDFDDAIWVPQTGLQGAIFPLAEVWRTALSAADRVIAGNDYLAERASRHARDVVVVPSCVDMKDYTVKSDFDIQRTPSAVWMGSPATESFLKVAEAGLLAAHRRTGLRLRVISRGNAPLGALAAMVDRIDWSLGAQREALSGADFAIAPLRDDEFARGKCAYKVLQYAAAGLPIAGSPVGANQLALNRFDGVAVDSEAEWGEALIGLVAETAGRRAARGMNALTAVRQHYSFERWADVWRSALNLA